MRHAMAGFLFVLLSPVIAIGFVVSAFSAAFRIGAALWDGLTDWMES